MAAKYPPTSTAHGLSKAANALDPERLRNETLVAEQLLGLGGTSFTGDDAEKARTAVARQINLQVRVAENPDVVAESRGRQSVTYARSGGARATVDPTAAAIVKDLIGKPSRSTAVANQATW